MKSLQAVGVVLALVTTGCAFGRITRYDSVDGKWVPVKQVRAACLGGKCESEAMKVESAIRVPDIGQVPIVR